MYLEGVVFRTLALPSPSLVAKVRVTSSPKGSRFLDGHVEMYLLGEMYAKSRETRGHSKLWMFRN